MESGIYTTEEEMKFAQRRWLRWGIYTAGAFIILLFALNILGTRLSIFKLVADTLTR